MKYKIGDKVELTNGCIVVITDIQGSIGGEQCYIAGISPIPEERIIRKIEDYEVEKIIS